MLVNNMVIYVTFGDSENRLMALWGDLGEGGMS